MGNAMDSENKLSERALAGDSASILGRTHLSKHALFGAYEFALQAKDIETSGTTEGFHPIHRAYVMGAVVLSVAAMESAVNEFFDIIADGKGVPFAVGDSMKSSIQDAWNLCNPDKMSILDKYRLAFSELDSTFDLGSEPCQSASLLIKLRNAIIHSRPEWSGGNNVGNQNKIFWERLRNKFPQNEMMRAFGNPFFPDKCLGYGCAKWSVNSSYSLIQRLYDEAKGGAFEIKLSDHRPHLPMT